MPSGTVPSVGSQAVDPDDGAEQDGSFSAWLPPEDRLWRHPSEMESDPPSRPSTVFASRPTGRVWTVALVAGLVGALLASGIGAASGEFGHGTTVVRQVKNVVGTTAVVSSNDPGPTWPTIFNTLSPSIVAVSATGDNGPVFTSGVVWGSESNSSYILTDALSLAGTSKVSVSFSGTTGTVPGTVVGSDPMTGIAVVKVHGPNRSRASLGTLTDVRAGEEVAAMGAPAAASNPGQTVATGAISALDSEVQTTDTPTMLGLISVSTVSPSLAGAALVEPTGAVVGITVSAQPANAGGSATTYAVPIDIADRVGDQLVAGASVTHPWLGVVAAEDLPTATASSLGLPGGAEVLTVADDSPAQRLGLEQGDTITHIGNTSITSVAGMVLTLDGDRPGATEEIQYLHQGHMVDKSFTVASRPAQVVP